MFVGIFLATLVYSLYIDCKGRYTTIFVGQLLNFLSTFAMFVITDQQQMLWM